MLTTLIWLLTKLTGPIFKSSSDTNQTLYLNYRQIGMEDISIRVFLLIFLISDYYGYGVNRNQEYVGFNLGVSG